MENISYPIFFKNWNALYLKTDESYEYFRDLDSLVEESCICSNEKEFESLCDAYSSVTKAFDDLLTSLEWYRHCAFKSYRTTPKGVEL